MAFRPIAFAWIQTGCVLSGRGRQQL